VSGTGVGAPPTPLPIDRDALLATKVRVPRPRADLLSRPRLLTRLDNAVDRDLTLVSAPAGFGKTSLLIEWARGTHRRVGWVALDEDDNDPIRFWRYLVAAADPLRPGLEEALRSVLTDANQMTPEAIVTRVVNALVASATEIVLVLDDYHLIESPAVHRGVSLFLEHMPEGVHLVIAGRIDPPLSMARMRAHGQIAEVRADDLRFTLDEASTLARDVWNLSLPDATIAALATRTEGWITGFHLAGISLREVSDAAEFVDRFSGSSRYILDYLTEEVLQRQPDDVRRFLVDTAILTRLNAGVCDAITSRADGHRMLERLERSNLFLFALDDDRRWYRYHQLFADLLRARLEAESPTRAVECHRAAAAWFVANGFAREAIRHALASGDSAWAAALVEESVDDVMGRGEGATLREWLRTVPLDVVRSRPRLCLIEAVTAFNEGHIENVEPLLRDAERGAEALEDEPDAGNDQRMSAFNNVPAFVANLRASLACFRGDGVQAKRLAQEALTHLSDHDGWSRVPVRWNLALADWLQGRLTEAERGFAEILRSAKTTGPIHMVLSAADFLARVRHTQGRLSAALQTYRDGLEFAERSGQASTPSVGTMHVGIARVLHARNDLEGAKRHADQGITLAGQLTSLQPLAAGYVTLAWIRLAEGDRRGAVDAMDAARQAFPDLDAVALLHPVPVAWARLSLLGDDVVGAANWLEELGLTATDEPRYAREQEYLLLVRTLLARDEPDQALHLLHRLSAAADAQRRTASVIEIRILQAVAFAAAGDRPRGLMSLVDALTLAQPEQPVRIFVDEGPPLWRLLGSLIAAGRRARPAGAESISAEYLGLLNRAARGAATRNQGSPSLVESLTERESEILAMLAAGKRNREIAASLVVTLDTVKKHVTHTLDKLGATNRTQAVTRARQLGLIP
jgi:LuxR family maltose regulon positive regulatory protein